MTKETKIGLLVGLTFIILFAIILSEKGRPQRDAEGPIFAGSGLPAAAARASDSAYSATPLANVGRMTSVDEQLPPIVDSSRIPTAEASQMPEEQIDIEQLDGGNLPALPNSILPFFTEPQVIVGAEQPATDMDEEPIAIASNTASPGQPAPPTSASHSRSVPSIPEAVVMGPPSVAAPASPGRPVEPSIDLSALDGTSLNAPRPPVGQSGNVRSATTNQPLVVLAMHKVRSGESLGKIAAQHYGRSTPARVQAIFQANRDQLKDLHRVKDSQTLRIPKLEEVAPGAFEPAATPLVGAVVNEMIVAESGTVVIPRPIESSVSTRRSTVNPPSIATANAVTEPRPVVAGFRWYEVQPKDTLSGIARRQLGDQRRFLDIYRLNQDRLGNMNTLKPGSKIRLPSKAGDATTSHSAAGTFAMDALQ